ncbi:hypothetical protein ACLOJK_018688 [Asimina triloba]
MHRASTNVWCSTIYPRSSHGAGFISSGQPFCSQRPVTSDHRRQPRPKSSSDGRSETHTTHHAQSAWSNHLSGQHQPTGQQSPPPASPPIVARNPSSKQQHHSSDRAAQSASRPNPTMETEQHPAFNQSSMSMIQWPTDHSTIRSNPPKFERQQALRIALRRSSTRHRPAHLPPVSGNEGMTSHDQAASVAHPPRSDDNSSKPLLPQRTHLRSTAPSRNP